MMLRAVICVSAVIASIGCAPTPESSQPAGKPNVRALGPLQEPPDRGSIMRMLASLNGYPLSRHESCRGMGTRPDDQTIGDFLAGFMAEQDGGINSVTAECPSKSDSSYRCEVYLRHSEGEDEWAWGVGFDIQISDGAIVDGTVRCLGAG